MRIVNIVYRMAAGGAQARAMRMAAELRKRGHVVETWFLYLKSPTYIGHDGVRVLLNHLPRGKATYIRVLIALIRELRAFRPDGVVTYGTYANIRGQIGALIAGVPVRVASQGNSILIRGRLARCLDWMIGSLGVYTVNIAISHSVYESFQRYPTSYVKRLRVIHSGLVFNESLLEPAQAREKFRLPQQVPLVVNTGRLVEQKNQEILLRALSSLPEVHLAVAGDGVLKQILTQKAAALGVQDRVHLLGEIPPADVPDFLRTGDLFAFPSLWEGFGFALLEAMCASLPVIASDIPVMREIAGGTEDEPVALLVSPKEDRAWAQAIRRILDDNNLRSALSLRARQRASVFSLKNMVDGYEQCLSDPTGFIQAPS